MQRPAAPAHHLAALLVPFMLAACGAPATAPSGPYARYLKGDESVRKVSEEGPFTLLDIEYRSCCGYLFSAQLDYQRILYRGKVVAKKVERVEPFRGFGRPALVWPVPLGDGKLQVLSEHQGKAVFDTIDLGLYSHDGEDGYYHGYPIAPGVRYFPRNGGVLLSAFPIRVRKLPAGLDCCTGHIGQLAGTAPDGSAYAYADSRKEPGAMLVVDADGGMREPVPLPVAQPAPAPQDLSPHSPLLRWFETSFTWTKNVQGKWNVAPLAGAPQGRRAPVEELFLDVPSGYRHCFATDNASCQPGWRLLREGELATIFKNGYVPPYTYVPSQPTQAFGAPVGALMVSRIGYGGTGYYLYVEDSADKVVAAFARRLRERRVPFVRIDECPRNTHGTPDCAAPLRDQLGWQRDPDYSLENALRWRPDDGAMFVLPTVAVRIVAAEGGTTLIGTAARYPSPPPLREK
ncbi:hypothetical protein [Pseudoduganella chitinolytica]|uniref:Uncharacterized protein n=1 Tax=Pseudoduganella chitinolytica TaxID=34070 RepID=A0ABY8B9T3_9BURK|nr:hypothetical protein [Pseudoduganella chitinolytica]WEF32684.1 hypothetical protein PX653_25280 [Pseudoduganella chitinolytica]